MICSDSARLEESQAVARCDDISPADYTMVKCKETDDVCAMSPVCLCVVAGNGGH